MVLAARLTDGELNDIAARTRQALNDDGLRSWYQHDVGALLSEVLILRREVAEATQILTANPPLKTQPLEGGLVELVTRLAELWQEAETGIWQRAEVKRIKAKLDAMGQELATALDRHVVLEETLTSTREAKDALTALLEDTQRDAAAAVAKLHERYTSRLAEIGDLARQVAALTEPTE